MAAAGRSTRHQFCPAANSRKRADLILQFIDNPAGEFRPDAIGARDHRGVAAANRKREILWFDGGQYRKPHLAAHTLHPCQKAEPVALFARGKADETHVVFADLHFGEYGGEIVGLAKRRQCPRACLHQIADAIYVDDQMVHARFVNPAI